MRYLTFTRLPGSLALATALCAALAHSAVAQLPVPQQEPVSQSAPLPVLSNPRENADTAAQSYVLGAGDTVEIAVFDYEEFTGAKVILPDGNISLSLIGTVPVAGLTVEQLTQSLTNRLQPFLVNPVVTVVLTTLRPVTVNVAGEVQHPGPIQLSSSESSVKLTLSSALVAAGGVTQDADIRQVILRRANGNTEPVVINLWNAIASESSPADPIVQDGDSIYVSRLLAEDTTNRRLLARSSFSPKTVRVRVVGEVTSPGEVQVPPDSSLSSAVAIAGGPTDDARLSRVAFIRMNEAGRIDRQTLDLQNLTDNYQVQEGDVIIVPKKSSSSVLDFAGRLFSPLGGLLNLLNGVGNLLNQ